jgi:polyisoprenoid-binding protein YceI
MDLARIASRPAIYLVVAVMFAYGADISARDQVIDSRQSTVTVRVFRSGVFRAFGDNHIIQAPIAEGSFEDAGALSVHIAFDANRLRVLDPDAPAKDREEVQARMLGPDVLDADRFPTIRFRSTKVEPLGQDRWMVRGDLELHGQSRPVALQVKLEKARYTGSATVRQTDFGIQPISIAGGAVKVKDEVTIQFDIASKSG